MSRSGFDGYEPQGTSKKHSYLYSPLQASSEEIRLLTLLPGPFGTAIQCELHTTNLNKDSPPRYEALSYAWGSEEDPVIIYIEKGTLPVTQNLAGALQHLRYPDRSRTLWIDAICVNQKDLSERSQQVARMADIYTLADCVVVWLGPEADDSPRILRMFEAIGSMIDADWMDLTMKPSKKAISTGDLHWADETAKMPFQNGELNSAVHLLARPWFERLWIRQEITLATKAVLVCGFDSLLWFRFRAAILYLYAKITNNRHVVNDSHRFWECLLPVTDLCSQDRRSSLREQILSTRHCKCMDPRDRIYALLSISMLPDRVHIAVDYRQTVDELLKDVALQFYEGNLTPLLDCEMQNKSTQKPSWVPNWSTPRLSGPMPVFQAGGRSHPHAKHIGGNVLRVIGTRVTKVRTAECMAFPRGWESECIAAIRKHAPSDMILDGTRVLDMYCRTLLVNRFSDFFEPPRATFQKSEEAREVLMSFLDKDRPAPPIAHKRLFLDNAENMRGRTFLWTEDGRMGLGPGLAATADEIVVFPGCRLPIILRPSQDGNSRYRVVGECFIHDIMNGEVLLGPLPEGFKHVKKLDLTAGCYYNSFRDTMSGETQDEDPRFGLLYSEMREDGRKRVFPTGPPTVEDKGYIGLHGWTSWRRGPGSEVEIMRNDLEAFLLE